MISLFLQMTMLSSSILDRYQHIGKAIEEALMERARRQRRSRSEKKKREAQVDETRGIETKTVQLTTSIWQNVVQLVFLSIAD